MVYIVYVYVYLDIVLNLYSPFDTSTKGSKVRAKNGSDEANESH